MTFLQECDTTTVFITHTRVAIHLQVGGIHLPKLVYACGLDAEFIRYRESPDLRLTYKWPLSEPPVYRGFQDAKPVVIGDVQANLTAGQLRIECGIFQDTIPRDAKDKRVHIMLVVTDDSRPTLTRYRCLVIDCRK